MAMKGRRVAWLALILLAGSAEVMACTFRSQTLTTTEALAKADSVFLGTITAIEPGLPADFKPQEDGELGGYQSKDRNQVNYFKKAEPPSGQTLRFAVEQHWKGVTGKTFTVLNGGNEMHSSCDATYGVQLGDRMLVFAYQDGNYAVLPRGIPDPLSGYNTYDPTSRHGKVAADHPYAKAIADAAAWFQQILQELPQPTLVNP